MFWGGLAGSSHLLCVAGFFLRVHTRPLLRKGPDIGWKTDTGRHTPSLLLSGLSEMSVFMNLLRLFH